MVRLTAPPWDCWSELTSFSCGSVCSAASSFGAQVLSSSRSESDRVYWYCAWPARPPTLMSCAACRKVCAPTSWASLGRSRAMIWSAVALRPASLRLQRDVQVGLVGAAAADEDADARRRRDPGPMTWATCWTFCLVLAKEASCEVIITPLRKPVSCCGKKPVGAVA